MLYVYYFKYIFSSWNLNKLAMEDESYPKSWKIDAFGQEIFFWSSMAADYALY